MSTSLSGKKVMLQVILELDEDGMLSSKLGIDEAVNKRVANTLLKGMVGWYSETLTCKMRTSNIKEQA
jgi:hypothetical protein